MDELTPDMVLYGYSIGVFPMAHQDEDNAIYWMEPEFRGIIPLEKFKVSKSLRQTLRSGKFYLTLNTAFEEVIRMCGNREDTWISEEIIDVYCRLHEMGYALSFETRNADGMLVGGLYGVAMGRAFFGESMFHTERDASKVALFGLVEWMKEHGLILLDTQYITDHLKTMGAEEITRDQFKELLQTALQ